MKIHKEGHSLIISGVLILAALNAALFFFTKSGWILQAAVLLLSLLKTAFLIYFFRSPDRSIGRTDDSILMAPADGKVVVIEKAIEKEYLRLLQID